MTDTELIDHTGRTVFRGTQKPPGGGSQPAFATYDPAAAVTIADNGDDDVSIGALNVGSALLDLTDPAHPAFLSPGTYAVSAFVYTTTPLTSGGTVVILLSAPLALGQATAAMDGNVEGHHSEMGLTALAVATVDAQLSQLSVHAYNFDGAASRDFACQLFVVRLA